MKWHTVYVTGAKGEASLESLIGTLSHEVLELVMQLSPEDRSLELARKACRSVWAEFTASTTYAAWDEVTPPVNWTGFRRVMWAAVSRLWRLENPEDIEVLATEVKIDVVIDGVPFRGVIDRVDKLDEGIGISDYKTGRIPSDWYSDKPKRQVLLYAEAYEQLTKKHVISARLVYLKGKGKVIEADPTQDNRDEAIDWISGIWDRLAKSIENDAFEYNPGPLCGWCPNIVDCTAGHEAVKSQMEKGRNVGPGEDVLRFLKLIS